MCESIKGTTTRLEVFSTNIESGNFRNALGGVSIILGKALRQTSKRGTAQDIHSTSSAKRKKRIWIRLPIFIFK